MKATIVGTLSGISAALIMMIFGQRPVAPVIQEIPVYRQGPQSALTARFLASSRPSADIQVLGRTLPHVKCDAMPLSKFIAWIAETSGANIYVEWQELAATAAEPGSKVTLDLHNVSASAALQLALDQCRLTGERLGFVSVDGVVKVSTHSRLDHWTTIRVYDVRDIIQDVVAQGQRKKSEPDNAPFQEPKDPEGDAVYMIRSILLKCINNEAWPNSCEISYFSGRFVISDTIHNHELIAAMLAALRAKPE